MGEVVPDDKPAKKPKRKTAHLQPPWLPGQSGNPKGRKPGCRVLLTQHFLREMAAHFEREGAGVIERVALEQPAAYLAIIAKLVPKEGRLSIDGSVGIDLPTEQRRKIAESWLLGESALIESEVIERVATPRLPAPARDEPDTVPNRQPDKPAYHHRKKPGRDLDEFE